MPDTPPRRPIHPIFFFVPFAILLPILGRILYHLYKAVGIGETPSEVFATFVCLGLLGIGGFCGIYWDDLFKK